MPPKVELPTFIAKGDSTIASLNDLFEVFHMLYQAEPVWSTLENVYKEAESVKSPHSPILHYTLSS